MSRLSSSIHDAAGHLQRISDGATGERARRAVTGALVLRVVECSLDGGPGLRFVSERAAAEVDALEKGAERSILRRLLLLAEEARSDACGETLGGMLVDYAYELERTQRLPEADTALALARGAAPRCAEVALHAGRVARKLREPERALALYVAARELDRSGGSIGRLASLGEAVVSAEPERALGRAIRAAVASGDAEAAAVGLEERARVRRSAGDRRGAIRDLCVALLRFADPVDRARVAHELTDVALTLGDGRTASEALLLALRCGDGAQRDHARSRLHTLARSQGDEVGMRRWRSFGRPALVSLTTTRAKGEPSAAAAVLARLRAGLEAREIEGAAVSA